MFELPLPLIEQSLLTALFSLTPHPLFVIICCPKVFGTLTLMVQEKGPEVGILKAMGVREHHVVTIFVLEGLLIGVLGAALGLGLGYVACFAAEHFGLHMNPEVYYIDTLPVHIDPVEFGLVGNTMHQVDENVEVAHIRALKTVYARILADYFAPR